LINDARYYGLMIIGCGSLNVVISCEYLWFNDNRLWIIECGDKL